MSTTVPSTVKFDVYRAVTDKIVQAIEVGAGDFVMPWHSHGAPIGRPTNAATKMSYRGVNVVGLWAEAMLSGYGSGVWASFRQWQKLGANVRKGEHGTTIVFYKKLDAGEADESEDDGGKGPRLIARASWVFNASQVEGWEAPQPEVSDPAKILEGAEAFVAATGAKVRYGGDIACYRPREDLIEMPDRGRFVGSATSSPTQSHYATLLHELTHWTGPSHRLDRAFGDRFGDHAYAFEELVAELGAAFLCGDLGIANEPRADHAAYVASWLKVLDHDRRAVFTAAKLASAAAEYLANFSAPP
jgi:antirestriction protein ArdC